MLGMITGELGSVDFWGLSCTLLLTCMFVQSGKWVSGGADQQAWLELGQVESALVGLITELVFKEFWE